MLWDSFLYCINDSIQGNSETGNKVFVLPSKVAINIMLQWFHDIIIPNRQMGYHKLQFYDIVSGDFVLKEHEAAKWLTKENLDSVDWLPADQGLVEKIKEEL